MGGNGIMAIFDNVALKSDNFKGYEGDPPTTKAEYDALECWKDKSQAPSWASISSDMALEEVRKTRFNEYPSWHDQLEMQYDDKLNGTTTWDDAIEAIKAKYPKP